MTVEENIEELARLLAELEKRHPLDPAWPELRAQVQRMHADIEARIEAEILSALEEFRSACAALDPAVREKLIADLLQHYPECATFIK
jgi:F0F1-type ATP synthase membrane subunit b/b'